MFTLRIPFFLTLSIAPSLIGMQQDNQLITLIANDNTTSVQIPAQTLNASANLQALLAMTISSESTNKTINCSLLSPSGLPYLKRFLETKDSQEKNALVKQLVSQESTETIYSLDQHLDCWGLMPSPVNINEVFRQLSETTQACFDHTNTYIYGVTHDDGYFYLLNTVDGTLQNVYQSGILDCDEHFPIYALSQKSDGSKVYFGGLEKDFLIYDTVHHSLDKREKLIGHSIDTIQISPDESFYIAADHCYLFTILDREYNVVKDLSRYAESPILITPDSKCIIFAKDGISIANKDGSMLKQIKTGKRIKHLALADNGNIIVASDGDTMILYDLSLDLLTPILHNIKELTVLNAHNKSIIIGYFNGTLDICELSADNTSLNKIATVKHHMDEIRNIVFSPNKSYFAVTGADTKTCLFDKNGALINSWRFGHSRSTIKINFSPDSSKIILTNWQQTIICNPSPLYNLPEFNQLPPLLQQKVLHDIDGLQALSPAIKQAIIKTLCADFEQIGFDIPKIKAYLNSI